MIMPNIEIAKSVESFRNYNVSLLINERAPKEIAAITFEIELLEKKKQSLELDKKLWQNLSGITEEYSKEKTEL